LGVVVVGVVVVVFVGAVVVVEFAVVVACWVVVVAGTSEELFDTALLHPAPISIVSIPRSPNFYFYFIHMVILTWGRYGSYTSDTTLTHSVL
jgi:uncharacterized membrane protein